MHLHAEMYNIGEKGNAMNRAVVLSGTTKIRLTNDGPNVYRLQEAWAVAICFIISATGWSEIINKIRDDFIYLDLKRILSISP